MRCTRPAQVLEVARGYGLTRATHYSDYARSHPTVNPFRAAKEAGTSHTAVANPTVSGGGGPLSPKRKGI